MSYWAVALYQHEGPPFMKTRLVTGRTIQRPYRVRADIPIRQRNHGHYGCSYTKCSLARYDHSLNCWLGVSILPSQQFWWCQHIGSCLTWRVCIGCYLIANEHAGPDLIRIRHCIGLAYTFFLRNTCNPYSVQAITRWWQVRYKARTTKFGSLKVMSAWCTSIYGSPYTNTWYWDGNLFWNIP